MADSSPTTDADTAWTRHAPRRPLGLFARLGFFSVAVSMLVGILLGVGSFTFGYGQGAGEAPSTEGVRGVTPTDRAPVGR